MIRCLLTILWLTVALVTAQAQEPPLTLPNNTVYGRLSGTQPFGPGSAIPISQLQFAGTLGGVLTGTLPNPGMAAGAASANIGALSGALFGTLPNPTFNTTTLFAYFVAGTNIGITCTTACTWNVTGPASATTLTANAPVLGNGTAAMTSGTRSGNTTTFATSNGALTNGHCVSIDSNGNFIDAGGACTTGGGGGTVSAGTAGQLTTYASSGTVVSGENFATLAQGGLGASQSAATANQIPVFPGAAGGAVPTGLATWLANTGTVIDASTMYFGSGQPWCDPVAKGAVVNGSTDDQAAWTACVTAIVAQGGGVIYLSKPGVSCIKTASSGHWGINISASVTIKVTGPGGRGSSTVDACGANLTVVRLDCPYCQWENIAVNGTNSVSASWPAIQLDNISGGSPILKRFKVQFGTDPILINANDCVIEFVDASLGYGQGSYHFTNNGCRVSYGTADQGIPANIAPVENSLTIVNWAPSTFYGASFNGQISGTTLTVNSITSGSLHKSSIILGAGIPAFGSTVGPQVLSQLTGVAGGVGTYQLSQSFTIGAEAMTAVGDYVQNSGYLVQLKQAGTSGGSNPTNQAFGVDITDSGAKWQLVEQIGYAQILFDGGSGETSMSQMDITGCAYYNIAMNVLNAGVNKGNNSITQSTIGSCPLVSNFYLHDGAGLYLGQNHIFGGPRISGGQAIISASNFSGDLTVTGNIFQGAGTPGEIFAFLTVGSFYSFVGNLIQKFDTAFNVALATDWVNVIGNNMTIVNTPWTSSSSGTHNRFESNAGANPIGCSSLGAPAGFTNGDTPAAATFSATGGITALTVGGASAIPASVGNGIPVTVQIAPRQAVAVTSGGSLTGQICVQ